MTATATILPFPSIDNHALADVNGGFDVGRMVDNGNRYGGAGAALGGGRGTWRAAPSRARRRCARRRGGRPRDAAEGARGAARAGVKAI